MPLDAYVGTNQAEARKDEPACFIQGWTHQALMGAIQELDDDFPQVQKLSDYEGNATFLTAEVKRLDEELETLQEELPDASLLAQFLMAMRRACKDAIEQDANLYFVGEDEDNDPAAN